MMLPESMQVGASGHDPLFFDMEVPADGGAAGAGASGSPDINGAQSTLPPSRTRLDHLGKPVKAASRTRYKYARTFTIMFDAQKVCARARLIVRAETMATRYLSHTNVLHAHHLRPSRKKT